MHLHDAVLGLSKTTVSGMGSQQETVLAWQKCSVQMVPSSFEAR